MSLAAVFHELESESGVSGEPGTLERRLLCHNQCDLFVGVRKPGNHHTFRVRFPRGIVPKPLDFPSFKDMDLSEYSSQEEGGKHYTIQLRLANPVFNDVFTCLVEDISAHVSVVSDEKDAVAAFAARLAKWQRFLERHSPDGMTPEEQRGLYGELWFLLNRLFGILPVPSAVEAWTGPSAAARDFESGGGAVEVKTTVAKQHQRLQVNSEKQLDGAGLSALFLCHLALDQVHGAGETLPSMVHAVRGVVSGTPEETLFEDRLRDYGYLDIHEHRYSQIGYVLRDSHLFRVAEGFPRITGNDLVPGVGDVRYSIGVAECMHFPSSTDDLRRQLVGKA